MPDLGFKIEGADGVSFPRLRRSRLSCASRTPIRPKSSTRLRCAPRFRLEVTRRRYTAEEQQKLRDLFGEPDRWSQTLRNLLWTHVNVNVPPFHGETLVDLPVPCTFDFNVGATKYFHGLSDGMCRSA